MEPIQQFELLLKYHDWYYMMSDDHWAYAKGVEEARAIKNVYNGLCRAGQQAEAEALMKQYRGK